MVSLAQGWKGDITNLLLQKRGEKEKKDNTLARAYLIGGREFVEVKEFSVPDVVKSMAWCGENICLGIRREYVILNGTNGALSEVFPSGRIAPPLIVPLPSGELLLGKDNIGVFVDQNGKLLQDGKMCWSEAPATVVIHKPYGIARLSRHIEIRSLRPPCPLVQTVAVRDVHLLVESNNCVISALENSVYGLLPVPLGAQRKEEGSQWEARETVARFSANEVRDCCHGENRAAGNTGGIVQLTASGNFEEALALCKLLPPEDSSLRAAKEGSIHMRYGHYLFDNGCYEEAMEQFLASSVDITYALALYPSLALPKTLTISEPEKFPDWTSDAFDLSRVSSNASDEMDSSSPNELDEKSTLEAKKMNHNSLMALIKFLQKKRFSIIEKATAEVTEEVISGAVHDSVSSYDPNWPKSSIKSRGHIHISSSAREMAAVLDTALLQALLLTGQSSAAVELLKGPNYCDLKISEEFLRQRNSYIALLELYKCNGMHSEALKLLNQLVEESNSEQPQLELAEKFRPEMIIDYLKPLCSTDPMIVLEFSMHALQSCPTQTIELFLSGNLPADLVNSYLKQHAPNMQATYLELMLAMNENGFSTNMQNELVWFSVCSRYNNLPGPASSKLKDTFNANIMFFVQIYLSEVLDWYSDHNAQHKWDEEVYSATRKKLLTALDSISGYNAESLLKRLPSDALHEERAILLGKMNQHHLALSLYVHKLHMPKRALAYCDHVYESGQHQPSSKSHVDIYQTLLQIYLNPRRTTKEFEHGVGNMVTHQNAAFQKGSSIKVKGSRVAKKVAEIEGADDMRFNISSTDSGRSDVDGDESSEEGGPIMLDEALDLLNRRWDRINGAQALKLLPRETKLQVLIDSMKAFCKIEISSLGGYFRDVRIDKVNKNLLSFLEPLLKKSSEGHRNFSVIRSLRHSENLQVKDELYKHRRTVVKITSDSMCSLCNKKIGTSVFAVYPNGKTLVHFVCFRDSQNIKAVRGTPLALRKRG
ncbi:hypothetical protein ACLOJK_011738 [Asimina triloba]